jgi:hypothetical protein
VVPLSAASAGNSTEPAMSMSSYWAASSLLTSLRKDR